MQRLIVASRPVAQVLPEAITEACEQRHQAMGVALESTLTDAMRSFARRETDLFAELLSPTIGAAVRKAVAAAIEALMQRFNEALERSLSVRSIRWRIEARRTGRPFAEVVLVHTLIYRVEQVFLIHVATGLVLQHVVAEGAPSADPDQVASMLDALDSFGKEAFRPEPAGGHLNEFSVGELRVCIDWGPSMAVAVVIRGIAPRALTDLIHETRERLCLAHRNDLSAFVADVTPFERSRPTLEDCLHEQRRASPRRAHLVLSVVAALVVAASAGLFLAARHRHAAETRLLAAYQDALRDEPGIVVTSAARIGRRHRLAGFRDPLAVDPAQVIARHGYPPAELVFASFQSLDPRIVEERARRVIRAPPGVSVALSDGTLRVAGEAPTGWIDRTLPVASALPGVTNVDASELRASERVVLVRSAAFAVEAMGFGFAHGSARLARSQRGDLLRAGERVRRLYELSAGVGLEPCVTVVGHADAAGPARLNEDLAAQRAASVLTALRSQGLDSAALRARAGGVAGGGPAARNARFEVTIAAGRAAGCADQGTP